MIWTDYVGIFTGIIGAITGIFGAILSIVSYRKANTLKSLDLRLELRKAVSNCNDSALSLDPFIEQVDSSKKAVAAASGCFRSGMMEKWSKDVLEDKRLVAELADEFPRPSETFSKLTPELLEQELVSIHQIHRKLASIREKYETTLRKDDEIRKENRIAANKPHI